MLWQECQYRSPRKICRHHWNEKIRRIKEQKNRRTERWCSIDMLRRSERGREEGNAWGGCQGAHISELDVNLLAFLQDAFALIRDQNLFDSVRDQVPLHFSLLLASSCASFLNYFLFTAILFAVIRVIYLHHMFFVIYTSVICSCFRLATLILSVYTRVILSSLPAIQPLSHVYLRSLCKACCCPISCLLMTMPFISYFDNGYVEGPGAHAIRRSTVSCFILALIFNINEAIHWNNK